MFEAISNAYGAIKASYNAGTLNPKRAKHWRTAPTGPNHVVRTLPLLTTRSLEQFRNSPYVNNAIEKLVSNEIAKGITPRSEAIDPEFAKAANQLWRDCIHEMDADGVSSIYGMQSLASRTRYNGGEVFIRVRPRRATGKLKVPVQFQMLEGAYVPTSLSKPYKNNVIKAGIEFNKRGERIAYWVYKTHPHDLAPSVALNLSQMIRVPASKMIHHYLPLRPGQIRGEPITLQSILKNQTLESYDDAELKRKETRSTYTGFIERPDYEDDYETNGKDPHGGDSTEYADGTQSMDQMVGSLIEGESGEKLTLFGGDTGNENYVGYMRQQLMAIMAGMNLPYEIGTGDYKDVNDRVVRAIMNEFRRWIEVNQQLMIDQVCRPMWNILMDTGVLSGALPHVGYAVNRSAQLKARWRPQGWKYLHPEQDVNAKLKAIKGGLSSLTAELDSEGTDIETVTDERISEIKLFNEKWTAAGLGELEPALLVELATGSTNALTQKDSTHV